MVLLRDVCDIVLTALERVVMLAINGYFYAKLWLSTSKTRDLVPGLSREEVTAPISCIVPVLNEAAGIERMLRCLVKQASDPQNLQIIVVDAGCTDETISIVKRFAGCSDCKSTIQALACQRGGRGAPIIVGLTAADPRSHIMLMLHADTILPDGFDVMLRNVFAKPGTLMTAFTQGADDEGITLPVGVQTHLWGNYIKCCLFQCPMGDQALATTRHTLSRVGGFPDVPILEDIEFVKKVRKFGVEGAGRIVLLNKAALTSVRRFLKMPVWKLGWRNQMILIGYNFFGKTPHEIYRDYYGRDP